MIDIDQVDGMPLVVGDAGDEWRVCAFLALLPFSARAALTAIGPRGQRASRVDVFGRARGAFGYFDQSLELQAAVDAHRRLSITHLGTGGRVGVCEHEAQAEAIVDALMEWRAEFSAIDRERWQALRDPVRAAIEKHGGMPT